MAGPKKNAIWTFGIALISQADTDILQTSPTLAAGDITVSIDGANFNNIASLPTQIQTTGVLPVALTADEMNGDVIYILFHDVAGDEWQDALAVINTETGTISEIDTNVDAAVVDLNTPAQYKADVSALALEANVRGHADDALAAYAAPTKAEMDTAFLAQTGADGDTLETLSDQLDDVATLGAGAITFVYTLTSSVDGTPIAQADVWVTTDAGGGNVIARGTTDDSGDVTFYLDAGTYYVWRAKSGYEFANPDEEVVS